MESNQRKMITPTRFIAFLVLIVGGVVTFVSSNQSDDYVPSKSILKAIEEGGDALAVCRDGRDSFYVYLCLSENSLIKRDTLNAKIDLKEAQKILDQELPISLTSRYFLQNQNLLIGEEEKIKASEMIFNFYGGIENINLHTKDIFYNLLGKLPDSLNYDSKIIHQLLKIIPKDSASFTGKVHLYQSYMLLDSFKLEESLESSNKALSLLLIHKEKNKKEYGRTLENIMNIYYDMEEFESFREYASLAKTFYSESGLDLMEIERFSYNYNLILANSGKEYSLESLNSIDEYSFLADSELVDFRFNFLCANWNYFIQNDSAAVNYYQKAMDISQNKKNEISQMQWIDVRATATYAYMRMGDYDSALEIISEVKEEVKDFNSYELFQSIATVQTLIAECYILSDLATKEGQKNEKEMLGALDQIDEFLLNLELYIIEVDPENSHFIRNTYRYIYDYKFDLLYTLHLHKPNKGYNKLALFENDMLKANDQFYRKICNSKNIIDRFFKLRKQYLQSITNSNKVKIEEASSQVELDSIKKEFPEYYNLILNGSEAFLTRAKEYCNLNDVEFLEYYSGYSHAFGFLVSKEGIKMIKMDVNKPDIDLYQKKLDLKASDFDSISHEFNKYLYLPFDPYLQSENLVVISSGITDKLSFESFKVKDEYLLQDKTISYAYSIKSLLFGDKLLNNPIRQDSLIAYSFTDVETLMTKNNTGLSELQGAYSECIILNKIFSNSVKIISGTFATKDHFLENAFKYYIVHLASHGDGKKNSIRNNKLYFRTTEKSEILGSSELREIYNSNVQLLFLNACETNKGKEIVNEGNLSMARSFAEIGIENIITSSMPINDYSSYELSSKFYEYLSQSCNINLALRLSKIDYLEANNGNDKAHPFYWSNLKLYKS